jgi:hypothetical protein
MTLVMEGPKTRTISRNPLGFNAGDANLYRFVGNDPTTFTDPSGLQELHLGGSSAAAGHALAGSEAWRNRSGPHLPRVPGQPACDEHIDPDWLRRRLCNNDEQRQSFNRGCIGVCATRLGQGMCAPQTLKDTRKCFSTYEDAKAYQNKLKADPNTKGTPVLFAVDGYPAPDGGVGPKPVPGGLPNEVGKDFALVDYDYLTELQDEKGNAVWEHANHVFTKPDSFIIHTYLPKPADIPPAEAAQGKQRVYCVHIAANPKLTLLP